MKVTWRKGEAQVFATSNLVSISVRAFVEYSSLAIPYSDIENKDRFDSSKI